jgi:3-deoxy-manno-octulosonate cytidylyltransferase (CMP-KDO synthetase)
LRQEVPEWEVFFAVDGDELAQPLRDEGFEVLLTDPDLPSGTDRIAQANRSLGRETVINVQADEPMVERSHVLALATALEKEKAAMATLAVPFAHEKDFLDPNQVKVVLDQEGYALYFSRAPIPYPRDVGEERWSGADPFAYKHLGMYGYKSSFLDSYSKCEQGILERVERLEQLRALEHGYRIGVSIVTKATIGVDLPEDLENLSFC